MLVKDGRIDAALLTAPAHLFAEAAGLKVIDVDPLPMIWFTTVSTSLEFAQKNPDLVNRFLKGLIEGIHFFKTQPERAIKIIEDKYVREGKLNHAMATYTWQTLAPVLEPKLYPSMAAISNVYEEAKRQDKDAEKINPLELWDMQYLREIDDTGFIDNLYGQHRHAHPHKHDPDEVADKKKKQEEIIAAVKACGHLETEECDCA